MLILGSSGRAGADRGAQGQGARRRSPTRSPSTRASTSTSVSVTNVGPTWGDKVSQQGAAGAARLLRRDRALPDASASSGAWRSPRSSRWSTTSSSPSGVYAITGFEVTPATVVAFLTILGFSLYDTVVVFDKVKENEATLGTVQGRHLLDDGEPLAQPGADAVDQHLVRRAAAGGVAAGRRSVRARCASALQDFAPRAVRRSDHRRLLVDLRGHADPGVAQGARAEVPGDPRAGDRAAGPRRGPGRPGDRARPGRAIAAAPATAGPPSPRSSRADDVADRPARPPDEDGAAPEPPAEDGTAASGPASADPRSQPAPEARDAGVAPARRQQRRKRKRPVIAGSRSDRASAATGPERPGR